MMHSIEDGQSAECFTHKYENWDSEPSIHAKRPGLVALTCNPLTGDVKACRSQEHPGQLASWFYKISEL